MAGRRPKSSAEQVLAGNPGRRPLRNDPQPAPGRPVRPAWLVGAGRREWDRIVSALEAEHRLTPADGPTIELAAVAYARWLRFRTIVDDPSTPLVVLTEAGLRPHPAIALERYAGEARRKLLVELALTQGTRSRARTVARPADATRAKLEKFFSPRPTLVKGGRE